jgi:hypothetical protein
LLREGSVHPIFLAPLLSRIFTYWYSELPCHPQSIGVVVGAICEQSVILSGLEPCIGAVSIRVIGVSFIGLIAMVRTRELVATIVVVVARSIGRDKLRDPVSGIKGPLIVGIGRAIAFMGQTGELAALQIFSPLQWRHSKPLILCSVTS